MYSYYCVDMDDEDEGINEGEKDFLVLYVVVAVILIILCAVGLKLCFGKMEQQKEENKKAEELKEKVVTMKDVRD